MSRDETVPRSAGSRFRPEIQLLRAAAVLGVVISHVWPERLPGGFAGVDVFFVVSGFLITRHLMTELQATGRVSLGRFWARRVRRLLPAAFLVLAVSFVLTLTLVPAPSRSESLLQIVASALYAQNWVLIATATDYFAAEQAPTVVQHYWSLSVEEQFYVVWPLLLGLAWASTRARRGRALAVVGAVGVLSFVAAVVFSQSPASYFSTATRVWEFCAGAALALAPWLSDGILPDRLARLRPWSGAAGLVLIVASFVVLGPETPFPGTAALLPVVGAALVIAGGEARSRWSLGGLARSRPIGTLGDVSYSLYLWHWPLIVVLPVVALPFGGVDNAWRIGVLVLSLGLAVVTKRWVEDRFRRPRPGARARHAFALPLAGGAMAVTCALAVQLLMIAPGVQAAEARLDALRSTGCFGAEAVVNQCDDPFGPAATIDPAVAAADRTETCPGTAAEPRPGSVATCEYRVADALGTVALVGDSHAGVMAPVVAAWAAERRWSLRLYEASACSVLGANRALAFPNPVQATTTADQATWKACTDYGDAVQRELLRDRVDALVFTNSTRSYLDPEDAAAGAITSATIGRSLGAAASAGIEVVVLRDVPGLDFGMSAPTCLALNAGHPERCSVARSVAVPDDDPLVVAATERGIDVVELTDLFCDARRCNAVVGGVVAYWDRAHLTATMRESLAPTLATRLSLAFDRAS